MAVKKPKAGVGRSENQVGSLAGPNRHGVLVHIKEASLPRNRKTEPDIRMAKKKSDATRRNMAELTGTRVANDKQN